MSERIWVVDRIEGDMALLVEDGTEVVRPVPRQSLPKSLRTSVREGDVLRVPVDASGEPAWAGARADERLRQERLDDARTALERLRRRDPGGDVKL